MDPRVREDDTALMDPRLREDDIAAVDPRVLPRHSRGRGNPSIPAYARMTANRRR